MEKELENLLGFLCVNWGFCIPSLDQDRISKSKYWEASEFAKAVLAAEGMNPETEVQWVHKIRNKFIEVFGSNEVNANDFK